MKLRFPVGLFVLAMLACGQPPIVKLGRFVAEPIEKSAPDYSEEARIAQLEGTVSVASTIGEDGHPKDLHLLESLGLGLDERALEAVREKAFEASAVGMQARIEVRYALPQKSSRWHLIHAEFQPGEGVSRPQFLSANYPTGAGILSGAAVDEGRLLGAMGREGTAALAFTVDERGVARGFEIVKASEDIWAREAMVVLSEWHFNPGLKDGRPVAVAAQFELAWGPREIKPERIRLLRATLQPDPPPQAQNQAAQKQAGQAPKKQLPLEILQQVQPSYTQEARDAKLEGVVVITLTTQADGSPRDVRVDEGLSMGLDEKALEAARQWRFKPLLVNGVFSPSELMLRFYFKLK